MIWWYEKIHEDENRIIYAYACERKPLDGRIIYSVSDKETIMDTPCTRDKDNEYLQKRSLRHFLKVVENGFPEKENVCCG